MDIKKVYDIVNLDKEKKHEFVLSLIKEIDETDKALSYEKLAPIIII
ncbi:MAG: hypothetical protein AABW46_03815 [Nanoarchaeota archaeon]